MKIGAIEIGRIAATAILPDVSRRRVLKPHRSRLVRASVKARNP